MSIKKKIKRERVTVCLMVLCIVNGIIGMVVSKTMPNETIKIIAFIGFNIMCSYTLLESLSTISRLKRELQVHEFLNENP